MKTEFKGSVYDAWCPENCKKVTEFTEYLDYPGGYLQGVHCGSCNLNRQMQTPPTYSMHPYYAKCPGCEKEYTVLTQDDRSPEYYTDIYIVCDCKELVNLDLPVN